MKMNLFVLGFVLVCLLMPNHAFCQFLNADAPNMKIYCVNPLFYPFVNVYFRALDSQQNPLVNITKANIGLMVQGKAYDPVKNQYSISTLRDRREGFRTVIIIDCSASMKGQPFRDALDACRSYIGLKNPSDEIAIIALTNEIEDVSTFSRDAAKLTILLNDLQPNGKRTRIYDGISKAFSMCLSAQGSTIDRPDFTVLSNILLITDGIDQGSAATAQTLMTEFASRSAANQPIFPIYTMAYSKKNHDGLKDMQAISYRSFGRYWKLDATSQFAQICNQIQDLNRHDYVITFRSYVKADGEKHSMILALNYEGRQMQETASFLAIEPPIVNDEMRRMKQILDNTLPFRADEDPYYPSGASIGK